MRRSCLTLCIALLFNTSSVLNACTSPPATNQWWAPGTEVLIYIDPSFGSQLWFNEGDAIQSAVDDWFSQSSLSGNNITYSYTATDPGVNASNVIRIIDDPNAFPDFLAFTQPNIYLGSGQFVNATIFFNRDYVWDAETATLAYDPLWISSVSFFRKVFDHELGHALGGLGDMLIPIDPSTSEPNACLQTTGESVMNAYCGQNDTGWDGYDGVMPALQSSGGSILSCDNNEAALLISGGAGTIEFSLPTTTDFTNTANWTFDSPPVIGSMSVSSTNTVTIVNADPHVYCNAISPPNIQGIRMDWNGAVDYDNFGGLWLTVREQVTSYPQSSYYIGAVASGNGWTYFDISWENDDPDNWGSIDLATGSLPGSFNVGDVIQLQAIGSTIRLVQNRTTIAEVSDSTNASGTVGFGGETGYPSSVSFGSSAYTANAVCSAP